ncbi:MAG: hypothetical protein ACI8XZ_005236 [Gammaproteobacteria bacterium]|jgi:hypothetical protein
MFSLFGRGDVIAKAKHGIAGLVCEDFLVGSKVEVFLKCRADAISCRAVSL